MVKLTPETSFIKLAAGVEHRKLRHEEGDVLFLGELDSLAVRALALDKDDHLKISHLRSADHLRVGQARDQEGFRYRKGQNIAHQIGTICVFNSLLERHLIGEHPCVQNGKDFREIHLLALSTFTAQVLAVPFSG